MADPTVKVVIETEDKTSGPLKKVDDSFGGLGRTVKGIALTGAIVAVGSQLVRAGADAVIAASAVEEMQSKFDTVFGEHAGSVTSQLGEFADAANRSIFDLQGFAATLQDTFVPLGFARDQAADMSVEVVKLAEDLASFNNIPTEQVVMDMQSALVGTTETLRKYGVVAQVANQKQCALTEGIWDGEGAMTAQEKAAAILGISENTMSKLIRTNESVNAAWQKGRAQANFEVSQSLFKNATQKMNPIAQLFWLKCQSNWVESAPVQERQQINISYSPAGRVERDVTPKPDALE